MDEDAVAEIISRVVPSDIIERIANLAGVSAAKRDALTKNVRFVVFTCSWMVQENLNEVVKDLTYLEGVLRRLRGRFDSGANVTAEYIEMYTGQRLLEEIDTLISAAAFSREKLRPVKHPRHRTRIEPGDGRGSRFESFVRMLCGAIYVSGGSMTINKNASDKPEMAGVVKAGTLPLVIRLLAPYLPTDFVPTVLPYASLYRIHRATGIKDSKAR